MRTIRWFLPAMMVLSLIGHQNLQAAFIAPPGLPNNGSDLLDIVQYMANGNIANEDRCTTGEPVNDATLETSCSKGPVVVANTYFPNLAAGGSFTDGLLLMEQNGMMSDQLVITGQRPIGANMVNVAFELRSDPNSFLTDMMGNVLQGFGAIGETGNPQDVTDAIFDPNKGGQVTAFRVWAASDVPEPSTFSLLGAGLIGIAGYRFRRKQQRQRTGLSLPNNV